MVREIDTRDFTSFTGSGRGASARAAAADLTSPTPNGATLTARDVSGLTGNPKMLSVSAAPTVVGSLIDDALKEVRQSSTALGFAASTPAEFTPDSARLHDQHRLECRALAPATPWHSRVRHGTHGAVLEGSAVTCHCR